MVRSMRAFQRNAPALFLALHEKYGDLVRLPLGPYLIHLNTAPSGIKHVLQENNANYRRGRMYERFKIFFGNGLLTTDGDDWRERRRRANPAFHRAAIENMTTVMTDTTERILDRWHAASLTGRPVDVLPDVMDIALSAMGRLLFATDLEPHSSRVAPAMAVSLEAMIPRGTASQLTPDRIPIRYNRRVQGAVEVIDDQVRRIIRAPDDPARTSPVDLVDLLLADSPEHPRPAFADIRDEMKTIFMAGHETTGTGLGWGLHELALNPEVQERMAAEVDSVLAGRTPTFADLPDLPYTRAVVDETLRLHPPIWVFPREAVDDDVVQGYRVPKGSSVFMVPLVTHRHREYWEAPNTFDPDRFAAGARAGRPRFAYLPFGGGQRQCIGNQMALLQMHLSLAMTVQRYRLRLGAGVDRRLATLVSLRPVDGFPIRVERRAG